MHPSLLSSQNIPNWFVIEPFVGTGQPEGTREEWREIITAMKTRQKYCGFKRIAMSFDNNGNVWFWSPRNSSEDKEAMISANELNDWILYAEDIINNG